MSFLQNVYIALFKSRSRNAADDERPVQSVHSNTVILLENVCGGTPKNRIGRSRAVAEPAFGPPAILHAI